MGVGVSLNVGMTNLAFDGVNRGYQVVIPRDAVAGVPASYGDAVLDNTLNVIATLTTTAEVVRRGGREAGQRDEIGVRRGSSASTYAWMSSTSPRSRSLRSAASTSPSAVRSMGRRVAERCAHLDADMGYMRSAMHESVKPGVRAIAAIRIPDARNLTDRQM